MNPWIPNPLWNIPDIPLEVINVYTVVYNNECKNKYFYYISKGLLLPGIELHTVLPIKPLLSY